MPKFWSAKDENPRALLQAIQRGSNSMVESLGPDTVRACTYFLTRQELLTVLAAFVGEDDQGGGGGGGGGGG